MVLPAKIFEIHEKQSLGLMAQKLKDFHEEEIFETNQGKQVTLTTEILDLILAENLVTGVFSADFIQTKVFRRQPTQIPVTEEAAFWIIRHKDRGFLIVVAPSVARGVKKLLSNHVANKLSKALFITSRAILETRISNQTLKELHESNPQATCLIWFDQIDLPGVEKTCLAGSDLADTQQYQDYLTHGQIWYVVFEVQKRGLTVGITRNSVITLFSKTTRSELLDYIREDILELIE